MELRTKVVIVEDEPYVAQNLSTNLNELGYEVSATASSADDAYLAVSATRPDMVLMDVDLEGSADGIQAATKIYSDLGIPVVFLTAHVDFETLRRAQGADPFGYMSKPVVRVDLANTIETALARHRKLQALRVREAWLEAQLKSVAQGLIAVNFDGTIWFINPDGERLLGVSASEVVGKPFASAIQLRHSRNGQVAEDLIRLAFLQGRTIDIGEDYTVDRLGGRKLAGEIAISKFEGEPIGVVFTFRDDTVRHYRQEDFSNQIVRRNNLDCSRCEVKLDQVLKAIQPKLRELLPGGVPLNVSLHDGLYSIFGNHNILEALLFGFAKMAKEKLGNSGSVHVEARNVDFERRRPDGTVCRYVRIRVSYECAEIRPAQVLADTGLIQYEGSRTANIGLSVDLAAAKIQSALQVLRATARERFSEGVNIWDIDLPALASGPTLTGKDQHPALVIVIEPSASVRCALCESYLPDEHIECLGARNAFEALDWARSFLPGQIAALVLPEASYTPEIDQLIKESPRTAVLLVSENGSAGSKLAQNLGVLTAVVDPLASHELLRGSLRQLLNANVGLLPVV